MELNSKEEQLTQSGTGAISNTTDFWVDANEFLKSQLPSDFEDKLKEYVSKKNYNENEFRLFKYMLNEAMGFHSTVYMLKNYVRGAKNEDSQS